MWRVFSSLEIVIYETSEVILLKKKGTFSHE